MLHPMSRLLRLTVIAIVLTAAVWSALSHRTFSGQTSVITWDVYGYYLHLPALLKYGDIRQYAFVEDHMRQYAPSDSPYQVSRHGDIVTPTYTMGLAMLWLPLYGLADTWARLDPRFPADALSPPYQWMIQAGGLLALAAGLLMMALFLGRYLPASAVALTTGILGWGTNLFHYAAQEPGMPHVWLFALYAGLLLLLDRMIPSPRWWQGALLGGWLAVMALCRPTEALAALLLPALILSRTGGWQGAARHLRDFRWVYLTALLTGLLVLLPQLLLWKATTGQWVYNPYAAAGHSFHFLQPHLLDGLFSFRKGWLVYTPVMILPLAGLFFLRRTVPDWAPGIILFVGLNLWVVLSWHIWWYAGSFGMRALVQSYAVLALPLGVFLEKMRTWPNGRHAVLAFAGLCAVFNLFQTWQLRQGILKADGMNKSFYMATLGRVTPDKTRLRLLDIPETPPEPPLTRHPLGLISAAQSDLPVEWQGHLPGWPVKGSEAFSPVLEIVMTDSLATMLAGQWVEVSAEVFAGTDKAPFTQAARLVMDVQQEGGDRYWYGLHLLRVVEVGRWWPVRYEIRLPEDLKAGDKLGTVVWSTSAEDDFWVHRLELNLLGF